MKKFDSLSEREILALAISLEEEDERVYADFAEGLRESFPASAAVFEAMRADETGHRQRLLSLYQKQFGDHIPLIRRQDVRGFVHRMPVWLVRPLGLDAVRKQASAIEFETRRFYERAASRAKDVNVRQLLDDLAEEERGHENRAQELTEQNLSPEIREDEDRARHLKRAIERHVVSPLATLLATDQVSLGDMISINWSGSEPRLTFSKEAEGAIVPSNWQVAERLRKPAVTHSNGRAVAFPPTASVMH